MRTLQVTVAALAPAAEGVRWLRLSPEANTRLPAFEAGAHIDVFLPNGIARQYSLINAANTDGAEFYELAVGLAANSAGGSRHIHATLQVGQPLKIGVPRNNFQLSAGPAPVLFVAGGIGVTPIRAMVNQCLATGRAWQLMYAARSRRHAAFRDEFAAHGDRVQFHFDDEHDGQPADLAAALLRAPEDADVYCCGPAPMMQAVKTLCAKRPPASIHFEWFNAIDAAPSATASADVPFHVRLAQTGKTIEVLPGRSILDTLEEHGVIVASVCKEGICGTCECTVLEGAVDHRDQVLTDEERAANSSMMVCVSRAAGPELVLDL